MKRIIIQEVGSDDEERSHDPEGQRPRLIEQLPDKQKNSTEVLLMTASDKKALEMRNDGEKASTYVFHYLHRTLFWYKDKEPVDCPAIITSGPKKVAPEIEKCLKNFPYERFL